MKVWIELQLNPSHDLPRVHGKRIKALGGRYRACRGYSDTRYVHLPCTKQGLCLADELVSVYPSRKRNVAGTPVVFRPERADTCVFYIAVDSPPLYEHAALMARAWCGGIRQRRSKRIEENRQAAIRRREQDAWLIEDTSLRAGEREAAIFLREGGCGLPGSDLV